ncbi:unnamed protein product [Heligmosomoides polygyrus]|uniref:SKICH domain-containing protein n=1 Tax=Heligmosomoides polygyrus TaxID=6339 RepID=A0A183FFM8_HELPZ|nr:unnamed protein product [Heligmosomoides polygyrus]
MKVSKMNTDHRHKPPLFLHDDKLEAMVEVDPCQTVMELPQHFGVDGSTRHTTKSVSFTDNLRHFPQWLYRNESPKKMSKPSLHPENTMVTV